ncbi:MULTISPECIES: hypothetical protein [Bifidobacterium]|uniref:hypothetical protein n=1 Tax=Bifidobacterium TaxID=1678 RepID=UPI0018DB7D5B|nr:MULTISPECIES: hypothetical protein [Bifidobacterium]MBH9981080.1 hypothetical protein [Bifidobacterium asteroides]MBI0100346.1 hypothetical protein [Bifidobacterium sp. W8114]
MVYEPRPFRGCGPFLANASLPGFFGGQLPLLVASVFSAWLGGRPLSGMILMRWLTGCLPAAVCILNPPVLQRDRQ